MQNQVLENAVFGTRIHVLSPLSVTTIQPFFSSFPHCKNECYMNKNEHFSVFLFTQFVIWNHFFASFLVIYSTCIFLIIIIYHRNYAWIFNKKTVLSFDIRKLSHVSVTDFWFTYRIRNTKPPDFGSFFMGFTVNSSIVWRIRL